MNLGVMAGGLMNVRLATSREALLFSPCSHTEACGPAFCLPPLSGLVKEEQAAWLCPAAACLPPSSIHWRWIEHEGFSQAQERAFSSGRFRQRRPYFTGGLSRSVSRLYNVPGWQCNGNNNTGMVLAGAVSLVGLLFIYLGMLITCVYGAYSYSVRLISATYILHENLILLFRFEHMVWACVVFLLSDLRDFFSALVFFFLL